MVGVGSGVGYMDGGAEFWWDVSAMLGGEPPSACGISPRLRGGRGGTGMAFALV